MKKQFLNTLHTVVYIEIIFQYMTKVDFVI